ncbi:MAG: sel1 repeat family protein [Thermoguttaceae bacterium]|nr:sel1 repeat family protein [Thermoguttaceae bacterium]
MTFSNNAAWLFGVQSNEEFGVPEILAALLCVGILATAVLLLRLRDRMRSRGVRKIEKRYERHVRTLADQGGAEALMELASIEAVGGFRLDVDFNPSALEDEDAQIIKIVPNGAHAANLSSLSSEPVYSTLVRAAQAGSRSAKRTLFHLLVEMKSPKALDVLRELVECEVTPALVVLGQIYLEGNETLQAPRDPALAAQYFERASKRGSEIGDYYLGDLYRQGLGVERDPERAASLYERAVEKNDLASKFKLGTMLLSGEGIPADRTRGLQLLYEASSGGLIEAQSALVHEAERDNPDALNRLGTACAEGRTLRSVLSGRVYGPADAESLWLRAAQFGDAFAMGNLGSRYEERRFFDQAEYWYNLAVAQGDPDASWKLGTYYLKRGYKKTYGSRIVELLQNGLTGEGGCFAATMLGKLYLTGDLVARNDEEAFKLFKLGAAEKSNYAAAIELANCYATGVGTPVDLDEAARWLARGIVGTYCPAVNKLKKMVKKDKNARAARELGVCHLRAFARRYFQTGATFTPTNLINFSITWLTRGAKLGDARSMAHLGDALSLLAIATGSKARKLKDAVQWYRRAAEFGDAHAMKALGDCYRLGRGLEINDAVAAQYYEEAAERGSSDAMLWLAIFCYSGRGVPKDVEKARAYARRARDAGNKDAQEWLDLYELDAKSSGVSALSLIDPFHHLLVDN